MRAVRRAGTSGVGLHSYTRWLKAHKIDADEIAGLVPFSGQAITHFTVRAERVVEKTRLVIDDMAPLYHVRRDAPPLLNISGDRNKELVAGTRRPPTFGG